MNEKQFYEIPKIEVIMLAGSDVVTSSSGEDEWDDDNVRDDGWL